ncbi:MAG: regulator of protease activity HflC (stomatin/prohibitin superfamily) [Planctomycetota bacterium]|jgi:regulator of protease activity HflC (stomatin/prohibitin superfamily)
MATGSTRKQQMTTPTASKDTVKKAAAGGNWFIALGLINVAWISLALISGLREEPLAFVIVVAILFDIIFLTGFFVVGPNMSRVFIHFGNYRGTVRDQGFFWANPFTKKVSLSLKAQNVASDTIKVNDSKGSPIEIGAIVVWQVRETSQALFDVENYTEYVDIQIEAAVRQLASKHPYDEHHEDEGVVSLRGDGEQVADELQVMLGERLKRAGIQVLEARISHLAYAPEIASAMLQRQQAQAIIAARREIVEGAVSMVEQALKDLGERKVVELDDERRATLVGNLLVVLCGQSTPTPVLNTGSLYS